MEDFMHDKQFYLDGISHKIKIPDTCPHCGNIMEPIIFHYYFDNSIQHSIYTCQCTVQSCHKNFVLEYNPISVLIDYRYDGFQKPTISKNIKKLSPIFEATFTEASIAEAKHLNNISGLAFRKAFEFLVKDFAIYQNEHDTEKIRTNSLNNVIDMYYKDMPKIKELLHITRKIGNDETHYYRNFDEVDISDLKKLIYNFSLYINMILDIEEFSKKTS